MGSAPGDFTVDFADVALVRADGTVVPIYTGGASNPFAGYLAYAPGDTTNRSFEAVSGGAADSAVATRYFLDDHLGTTQVELATGGWPLWQGQFTPFGTEIVNGAQLQPGTDDGSGMPFKFTGKERDTESGLDYFGARYFGSNMGRFMSPDWSGDPDAIPYADLDNPQSLNLYSYVGNNPLNRSDPNGHQADPCAGNPNCVTVTADPLPPIEPIPSDPVHHYFPQSLFRNASQYARNIYQNWTTGGLKKLGLHKGYSGPHRAYNAKVKEIIQKVSEKYGKPIEEWGETEVKAAAAEIKAEAGKAGGEISTLLDDLEKNNPGATSTIKNIGSKLAEFEASPAVQTIEQDANEILHEVPPL